MKKSLIGIAVCLIVCVAGCAGTGSKVLQDFGIQDRPEGYESGTDRVIARMGDVGKAELSRLNSGQRRGDLRYDDTDALHGKYYKVIKKYDRYYPLDANATGRTSATGERGFVGYIEYSYAYYEGPRKNTRAEAAAQIADIPTGDNGRERYRYRFNTGGTWNGAKGQLIR